VDAHRYVNVQIANVIVQPKEPAHAVLIVVVQQMFANEMFLK
tara:strand:+ start:582 stop:707 length:126 start_codon:yes stop_codon:yes gene_type:complete